MQDYIMVQLVYLGRIAAAGLCGVAIGWERQYRTKAAGVRTHFIISVAASLMMIISKSLRIGCQFLGYNISP